MPRPNQHLDAVIEYALASGAARAVALSTRDIVIDAGLADKCRGAGCPHFGLSVNCPPHVAGPDGMRGWLQKFNRAVVFRMDVPARDLFSDKRRPLFQDLHRIAAGIEQAAVKAGFSSARGYAGGSCRDLFCHDHEKCRALSENGRCRFPEQARPSMSGFGIDVAALFKSAGWVLNLADGKPETSGKQVANICGLVLL